MGGSLGSFPNAFGEKSVLESIDENIILADLNYNVVWANPTAVQFLSKIAGLFGIENPEDIIGLNMSAFHQNPERQKQVMDKLERTHKTLIEIKDTYAAEIIINPIKRDGESILGYVVMLMDVTEKIAEQEKTRKLIEDLSVPILKVWDEVIAVPLKGAFNEERYDILIDQLLEESLVATAEYVILDFSGIQTRESNMAKKVSHICDILKLIGVNTIIVGMSPQLALAFDSKVRDWTAFSTTEKGMKYILKKKKQI